MAGESLIAKAGLSALARTEEAIEAASARGLSLLDIVAEGNTGKTVAKAATSESAVATQAKAMTFEERVAAASRTPVQKVQFPVNEIAEPLAYGGERGYVPIEEWKGQFASAQTDRNLNWLLKNTDAARTNKVQLVLQELDKLPEAEQISPSWKKLLEPLGVNRT
ncbi:MAG: hypothetical protein EKK48_12390 [Candidatus Melainabacteria bacterium]|nr:MAG: hypothetical protein EKK48_12390 [Candidatus Melainabacteria bacterium]